MEVETSKHVLPQEPLEKVSAMGKRDGAESSNTNSEIRNFFNEVPLLALNDALERVSLPSGGPVSVADLGSSSGPNSIDTVALIVDKLRRQLPKDVEFQAYFNDLPSNDFNNLFQLLTNDTRAKSFFAAGAPGSFYDRLFAESSVHVFYSSLSLHWISKIPDAVLNKDSPAYNRGNTWINHSRSAVGKAYQRQAAQDLRKFLLARGAELVSGGLLFLTIPGRSSSQPHEPTNDSWDEFLLDFNGSWSHLVGEGLLTEEQLDRFNIPCYMRSFEDVREAIASCDSLFDVVSAKMHAFDISPHQFYESVLSDPNAQSRNMGAVNKAVMNGLVEAHINNEAAGLLWKRYDELLEKRSKMRKLLSPMCIVALIRK